MVARPRDLKLVRFDRDNLFARRRAQAAGWLALLSLALVQLSLASHQFDHPAGDIAESCHICVQLERFEDATSDHSPHPGIADYNLAAEPHYPAVTATRSVVRSFDSRAPPSI